MANTRKLMGEIDRTLKKLAEGVDYFNEVWDKVYSAPSQKEKEKHEAELKKEIKKLQRFRDQIKQWIASGDVKDKKALIDARKLVETKMEMFKVCERETKTKAYSNDGLAQSDKLDPLEQAKASTKDWILTCLNELNTQLQAYEVDLERLGSKNKRQNKQEIQQLHQLSTRHRWHIQKLELLNRLLDNDAIQPEHVDQVKEDLEYYLEANLEPDFMETYGIEDIYEPLELDSLGNGTPSTGKSTDEVKVEERKRREEPKPPKLVDPVIESSIPVIGRPVKSSVDPLPPPSTTRRPSNEKPSVIQPPPPVPAPQPIQQQQQPIQRQQPSPIAVAKKIDTSLSEEHRQILRIVDASVSTAPENVDSERLNGRIVRNPYPTPASYPNTAAALFDNGAVFEKFDTDTLFFIFYYQQGTYQQYLAARELKKQTWAYHKKYMTWFKRHEEPKVTCEEYEQGTYVYFDYETGWCQRIKSEFTFEYSYLEDELI